MQKAEFTLTIGFVELQKCTKVESILKSQETLPSLVLGLFLRIRWCQGVAAAFRWSVCFPVSATLVSPFQVIAPILT